MGRSELTFLQRGHIDGQQVYEEMLCISNHEKNAKLKKQATFPHPHCCHPGTSAIRDGTWIPGFHVLSRQPATHCAGESRASPPWEGTAGLPQLLWRQAPRATSPYSAGSRIKHEAALPGVAGITLWPVHWPFCRLQPRACSNSCPLPFTLHPPGQDHVSPLAELT